MSIPKFDVARMIADLGGPMTVYHWFTANNIAITKFAIYKWRERGRIDINALAYLVAMGEDTGRSLKPLEKYLAKRSLDDLLS
jgi:hypothetical protein